MSFALLFLRLNPNWAITLPNQAYTICICVIFKKNGDNFINKIFSKNEILYCKKKKNPFPFYAKRFAAKEALSKALGTGIRKGIKFKNIEIGSYPFFKMGKVGVSIVMRSTEKNEIDDCSKQIVSFIKKKKIQIMEKE